MIELNLKLSFLRKRLKNTKDEKTTFHDKTIFIRFEKTKMHTLKFNEKKLNKLNFF